MTSTSPLPDRLIRNIYGDVPAELLQGIESLLGAAEISANPSPSLWSENDVVLIAYGDHVGQQGNVPLEAMRQFLVTYQLNEIFRCVHLLPFFPSTGDDGFSVSDYLSVDPQLGSWTDIAHLRESFDLMFDLVLNHCSASHPWFESFLKGDRQFIDHFITATDEGDLSSVIRPRESPLLTPFSTAPGDRNVWTTFSADQVDLNYGNPTVLLEMLKTLVAYAQHGARIIRLDAIAFLWKRPGTSCLNLPETHAVVKLMRWVLDQVAPGTLLLTETNVPHQDNVSYFGSGDDESHLVYQFSLPPLLLDAIRSGDATVLTAWMRGLVSPSSQTTFLNFTASHDGIGVRPLEGLLPPDRIDAITREVLSRGGKLGMRSTATGESSVYEWNITYLDAVADRRRVKPPDHSRRFLATQAIMLAMQGIPAIYFNALVGSPNDDAAVRATGISRRINRHKYDRDELDRAVGAVGSLPRRVFEGFRRLLSVRRTQPAFAPQASQEVLSLPIDGCLAFLRRPASGDPILVVANLRNASTRLPIGSLPGGNRFDILSEESFRVGQPIPMRPFQVRWLS